MWASQNGHAEVVKFLLDNKADPNLKTRVNAVLEFLSNLL